MDYINRKINQIKNEWFAYHTIQDIEGFNKLMRIVWGKPGSKLFQIEYTLSGNMVFVAGSLGHASYSLPFDATLENLSNTDLGYFTDCLLAYDGERWGFDSRLAVKQLKEYFKKRTSSNDLKELNREEKELFDLLAHSIHDWASYDYYEGTVYALCTDTDIKWLDYRAIKEIANCGKRISENLISIWLGLQMIVKEMERDNISTTSLLKVIV